jgi:hypothetical protein
MLAGASAGALIGLLGGNQLSVMAAVMALSSLLGILFLWLRARCWRAPQLRPCRRSRPKPNRRRTKIVVVLRFFSNYS